MNILNLTSKKNDNIDIVEHPDSHTRERIKDLVSSNEEHTAETLAEIASWSGCDAALIDVENSELKKELMKGFVQPVYQAESGLVFESMPEAPAPKPDKVPEPRLRYVFQKGLLPISFPQSWGEPEFTKINNKPAIKINERVFTLDVRFFFGEVLPNVTQIAEPENVRWSTDPRDAYAVSRNEQLIFGSSHNDYYLEWAAR